MGFGRRVCGSWTVFRRQVSDGSFLASHLPSAAWGMPMTLLTPLSVRGEKRLVTYQEWADLIQKNFERLYYVPADPSLDKDFAINPAMINRRGIYKDVY